MKKLYDITLKEASDFIIEKIAQDQSISKKEARKLFTNALLYNIVIEEIRKQADFIWNNNTPE